MESREKEQQISSPMREDFEAYAERMKQIRSLATPTLDEIRIPEEYSHVLKVNFQRIGEMAAENRKIIADYIQPVLPAHRPRVRSALETVLWTVSAKNGRQPRSACDSLRQPWEQNSQPARNGRGELTLTAEKRQHDSYSPA